MWGWVGWLPVDWAIFTYTLKSNYFLIRIQKYLAHMRSGVMCMFTYILLVTNVRMFSSLAKVAVTI